MAASTPASNLGRGGGTRTAEPATLRWSRRSTKAAQCAATGINVTAFRLDPRSGIIALHSGFWIAIGHLASYN